MSGLAIGITTNPNAAIEVPCHHEFKQADGPDRQRAARDENEKLKLEAQLKPKLDSLTRDQARSLARILGVDGRTLNVHAGFGDRLEQILAAHYADTGQAFSRQLREDLPEEIAMTPEEEDDVEEFLAVLFAARATDQAALIDETAQEDADAAVSEAREQQQRLAEAGEAVSSLEVAAIAGAFFSWKRAGRIGGIATLETQAAAEAAKQAELGSLLGIGADSSGAIPPEVTIEALKKWVTRGDSVVRPAHLAADFQEVPVREVFTVMGESLMFPGDTSRGATAGNVVNCRCASVSTSRTIHAARRQMVS